MRSLLFIIASFGITILCWGVYGPVLHHGQAEMAEAPLKFARLRPFICVGMAYFLIGVIVPAAVLKLRGEKGAWSAGGILWSLVAGALGAIGALGIILAFTFEGKPIYVMPLVFGGAPVVNAFLTIYWSKKMKEIGPVFLAGLFMVVIGAVLVMIFNPTAKGADVTGSMSDWVARILSVALVVVCWGAYGPVLHKGQSAMENSRLRPLICVGLAYFAIAVIVPSMVIAAVGESSSYTFAGTSWSFAAGAAGAVGALGIIMAFNFGGKPMFVMPLVFGGAPVVSTFFSMFEQNKLGEAPPFFLAGLILVIAGAAMVLVFAPRNAPPKKVAS